MKKMLTVFLAVMLTALAIPGFADSNPLSLSLIHVNDTHAKLESAYGELKVDIDQNLKGKRTFVELGGFSRLWTAVEQIRAEKPAALFLHAGDVFQGTLYFTQFSGAADRDFLNAMKLDAMTLGNHEFDKGPGTLAAFAKGAQFPIVACNLDLSAEPALAALVKPYVVKKIGGADVALVGVATPETPYISSPGPTVKFLDPAASINKVVAELEGKGVNKIVVLSHLGYEVDKALAPKVSGVDVIIGGHSHSLLGPMASLGLKSLGDYPTVAKNAQGDNLLVVTSWQWANAVGVLDVEFDGAGKIVSFKGTPKLLAGKDLFRIYDLPGADGKMKRVEFARGADGKFSAKEYDGKAYAAEPPAETKASYLAAFDKMVSSFQADSRFIFVDAKPEGLAKLKTYSASVDALKKKVASNAAEELKRFNNQGPGPIIADSMIWKTGADIAIMNPGGVRVDLVAGDVSVAQVYELQPFANTLMTMDLSGAEVVKVLEDMTDFCITTYNKTPETAYVYVAGLRMTLLVNGAKGQRVKDVQVKGKDGSFKALDPAATYKVVVNNFMGTGGDKNFTLGEIPAARKVDTGFIDSEAMLDYVLGKTLRNSGEERVKNVL
jgi:5'-nucleotidase